MSNFLTWSRSLSKNVKTVLFPLLSLSKTAECLLYFQTSCFPNQSFVRSCISQVNTTRSTFDSQNTFAVLHQKTQKWLTGQHDKTETFTAVEFHTSHFVSFAIIVVLDSFLPILIVSAVSNCPDAGDNIFTSFPKIGFVSELHFW